MIHVVLGTGPVGLALIEHLAGTGEQVKAVNRRGQAELPPEVPLAVGDVSDVEFTTNALRGASVVYQCLGPPYTRWPELFPPLQEAVVEATSAVGAKLVSFENLYMYGPTGGEPITEELPLSATGRKGRIRAQMARDLLDAHETGRLRMAIGRSSDYFGPRGLVSHMGERVFYPVLAGKNVQMLGDPSQPHTFTYIPDIAAGLAVLGLHDHGDGRAWHLPNAPTLTTVGFVQKIYEAAGTEGRVSAMPKPLINLVAWFNGDVKELKEILFEFDEPFVVESQPFEVAFGQSATPLDSAIQTTVDWFRANPKT